MNNRLTTLLLFVLTLANIAAGEEAAGAAITTEGELAQTIARLDNPKTSSEARRSLIKFSGHFLYEGSMMYVTENRSMDTLRRTAARALDACRNTEAVRQALDDADRDVRFWGVTGVETTYGRTTPWESLVPRLTKMAVEDPDDMIRAEAIRRLRSFETGRRFLLALQDSTKEASPYVLQMLLDFDSQRPEERAKYYTRAIEFLSHKDDTVRLQWLAYIHGNTWNPSTAYMWRIEANPGLINKLKQIRETGSIREKDIAGKVLECLLKASKETAHSTNEPDSSPAAVSKQ